PDNPDYGFLYLDTGKVSVAMTDFERAKFFSGQYLPGKYVIGVKRTTDSEFSTGYGVMVMSDQGTIASTALPAKAFYPGKTMGSHLK
ncbi:MAG: hypothetical protein V3W19_10275, partial [Desulfatiglandales bacterium]